jgi:hypothetical protein
MSWICQGFEREPHTVPHPADRGELKVEVLRAGSHDRRFHSRLLKHFCRDCAAAWWGANVEKKPVDEVEAMLF